MGYLPLEVGQIDYIVIDDADGANAGCRQIQQQRRAETAGADDQDARRLQLCLANAPDLLQQDVAGVALDFFFREIEVHAFDDRMTWSAETGVG